MEVQAPAVALSLPRSALRSEAAVAAVGLGVLVCAALWHLRWLGPVVVDDAAISLRYGLTFFSGGGLRLTPWSAPVEGFSDPLWVFLIGCAGPLHLPPIAFMQSLGIAFGLAALPVVALWGPAASGRGLRIEDLLAPLVAAANPSYLTWIGSGLETGVQALLIAVGGALWLKALRDGKGTGLGLGLTLGLLCWTHPEAPLVAAVAAGIALAISLRDRQAVPAWMWRAAATLLVVLGLYLLVRWICFADLLPNTFYAKRSWRFDAARYLLTFGRAYGPLCAGLWVSCCAVLALGGGLRRVVALPLAWIGCAALFAWLAHGDWMGEWRFFAPYLPLFGVPLAAVVSLLRDRARSQNANGLAVLAGVLGVAASAHALTRSAQVKRSPQFAYAYVADEARDVRDLTRSFGELHPRIGMPDLGGLSMTLPQADIVDVAGLADQAIAHQAGNLPAIEDYLLSEGLPTVLDVHGPSGALGKMHALLSHYLKRGRLRVLRGLSATADPRCPGGKAAVLSLEPDALAYRIDQAIADRDPETGIRLWRCARSYQSDADLPSRLTLSALADRAEALGAESRLRDPRLALRAYSLATVLDGGNAHRRRRTEALRSQLFPEPAARR